MKKTKKFNHKEIEICKLSKKPINTSKDDYSIIVDCMGDKIMSIEFYKTELLRDLIKGKGEKVAQALQERTQKLAGTITGNLFKKFGLTKEVYEVTG